jgi:ATP-dependent Clp protease protease subunit
MEYMQMQDRIIEEIKINSVLRKRTIYVNEEISSDQMFKLCASLDRIAEMDDLKGILKDKLEPIHVIYNSYGGSIYDGLMGIGKLEYMMDTLGYKIISTIQGYAMSMGQALAIVATERNSIKHSRIMIHQPSSSTWGKLKDMEEDVEETLELWREMKRIIMKYTKMTDEQLEEIKKSKTDKFMWETEALELGIIDKII